MRGVVTRGTAAAAATIALAVAIAAPAHGDPNQVVAQAELTPAKAYPKLDGRVDIVVLPYDAEVSVAFTGSPRRRDSLILFWLSVGGKKAWSGGGFPADINPRGVSAVIPGRRPVAKHHARAVRRVTLTLVPERQWIKIEKRGKRSGWRRAQPILGQRVGHGLVAECPPNSC